MQIYPENEPKNYPWQNIFHMDIGLTFCNGFVKVKPKVKRWATSYY